MKKKARENKKKVADIKELNSKPNVNADHKQDELKKTDKIEIEDDKDAEEWEDVDNDNKGNYSHK